MAKGEHHDDVQSDLGENVERERSVRTDLHDLPRGAGRHCRRSRRQHDQLRHVRQDGDLLADLASHAPRTGHRRGSGRICQVRPDLWDERRVWRPSGAVGNQLSRAGQKRRC